MGNMISRDRSTICIEFQYITWNSDIQIGSNTGLWCKYKNVMKVKQFDSEAVENLLRIYFYLQMNPRRIYWFIAKAFVEFIEFCIFNVLSQFSRHSQSRATPLGLAIPSNPPPPWMGLPVFPISPTFQWNSDSATMLTYKWECRTDH